MTEQRLLVLGTPFMSSGDATVRLRRSEAALVAFLADLAPRSIGREQLASLFWPHTPHKRALRSLSQLHYQVKKKVPKLAWEADSHAMGLQSVLSDVDLLAEYIAAGNYSAGFELVRGPFLAGPFPDAEELELWRARKQGQVVALLERALAQVVDNDMPADVGRAAAGAIDHLLATECTSSQVIVARVVLHLKNGETESAERLLATARLEFDHIPDLRDLAKQLILPNTSQQPFPQAPFVGRTAELAAIERHLDCAREGMGRLVVLAGEPGIGKTRLATQAVNRAALTGFKVHRFHAHSATQRVPCSTLTGLMNELCSHHGSEITPELLRSLQQPHADASGFSQFEVIRTLSKVIESQTKETPIVLYIDDTQWVDEITAQFIQYLSVRVESLPLMIILTLRTSEPDPTPDWLVHDLPSAHRIRVGQLDMDSARQLIDIIEGSGNARLTEEAKTSILWTTAGRPLLIAEVIRAAAARAPNDRIELGLSMSTEELLRRRFKSLDPDATWVYGIVAAVGRPLHIAELAELCGLPPNAVSAQTDTLLERGILEEIGGGSLDFSHDLLRQVAYRTLSGPTRVLLHRKIADHSIHTGASPECIAQHLNSALDQSSASAYALLAARKAVRESRYVDAEFFYSIGLGAPDEVDRQEAALALARLYFQSGRPEQMKLLAPHISQSQRGRQGQMFLMLAELGEKLKDGSSRIDDLVEHARSISDSAVLTNATEFVSIFGSLIDIALDASDRSLGDSIVRDFKRMAVDGQDPSLALEIECVALLWHLMHEGFEGPLDWIRSHVGHGWNDTGSALPKFATGTILMMAGELEASASALSEALELARRAHDIGRQSAIRANMGIVHTELGNYAEAQQHLEVNLAAPKHGHRLRSMGNLAILMLNQGDIAGAKRYCRNLLAANEQHQSARYSETAHAILGLAAQALNDPAAAEECFSKVWERSTRSVGRHGDRSYMASFAAKHLFGQGNTEDAYRALDESEAVLSGRDRIGLLRIRLIRAELLADARDERAYPYSKALLLDAQSAGAATLESRARSLTLRTRD